MNKNETGGKRKTSGKVRSTTKKSDNSKKGSSKREKGPLKTEHAKKSAAPQSKPAKKKPAAREGIRLNKYISNSGICSRREADTYIATGLVTVNGKVVNEMGYKVKLEDDVRFDGRRLKPESNVYVLLNKPKGFATTTSDSKGQTVMDLVANSTASRITPIGRLGRNATGLLLFTNDDQLKEKLSKKGMARLFHVELDKNLKPGDLQKIKDGLKIEGKEIHVEDVSFVENAPKREIGLKIKHMGNSVIRSIFDHLGYNVVRVDCVTLAHLTKKDLPRGRWKHLSKEELDLFGML